MNLWTKLFFLSPPSGQNFCFHRHVWTNHALFCITNTGLYSLIRSRRYNNRLKYYIIPPPPPYNYKSFHKPRSRLEGGGREAGNQLDGEVNVEGRREEVNQVYGEVNDYHSFWECISPASLVLLFEYPLQSHEVSDHHSKHTALDVKCEGTSVIGIRYLYYVVQQMQTPSHAYNNRIFRVQTIQYITSQILPPRWPDQSKTVKMFCQMTVCAKTVKMFCEMTVCDQFWTFLTGNFRKWLILIVFDR